MKTKLSALIIAGLAIGTVTASAQAPAAPKKTNAPNAEAMELLRRVIAEQQKNPDKIIRIPASTNALPVKATKADLERQYLAGQLSAKQYQKALDQLDKEEQRHAAELEKQRNREAQQAAKAAPAKKPAEAKAPVTAPAPPLLAATNAPAEQTLEQKKLSEVEARIDEMLRKKAEREKAAVNNAAAPTNSPAQTPKTKRQRMDALLKQMIDGKISDADYTAQRAKLLAEPD
jgi:type IV secretory pathway VirJ component